MLHGHVVVVVVPAFMEAPRIARVVRAMPPEVDHVIVVDDASTDETATRAREAGDLRTIVLRHAENRGVGAAIATGYAHALTLTKGPRDAFVVMAGDGQMDPADLPALVAPLARGEAGYVKGNRFLDPDVDRVMPRARRLGGLVFSWLTARAIGQPIDDSQCGYTALSRAACMQIDLADLWPRYGYPNDLLGQLAARGVPIAEVRVRPIYADEESKLRPRHLFAISALIARAYVRRRRAEQASARVTRARAR
jgi:glycosyltransferase involved in cell wall biosynthesis